jgi:hypothetical protein
MLLQQKWSMIREEAEHQYFSSKGIVPLTLKLISSFDRSNHPGAECRNQ